MSNNHLTSGWMAGVLVAPEFWWLEAASSSKVVIRDNTITDCRRAAIEVVAEGGDGHPLPAGAHREISILGNTVTNSPWPNIRVTSTNGLTLRGNHLTPEGQFHLTPAAPAWNWHGSTPTAVLLQECEHVTDEH